VAINSTLKILHLLGRSSIPVAASSLKPINDMPMAYKAHALPVDVLPVLNQPGADVEQRRRQQRVQGPGEHFLMQLLQQQEEPVVFLATGAGVLMSTADQYSRMLLIDTIADLVFTSTAP
jgi:inosine-uridine nucleoside N-ribohydrolase